MNIHTHTHRFQSSEDIHCFQNGGERKKPSVRLSFKLPWQHVCHHVFSFRRSIFVWVWLTQILAERVVRSLKGLAKQNQISKYAFFCMVHGSSHLLNDKSLRIVCWLFSHNVQIVTDPRAVKADSSLPLTWVYSERPESYPQFACTNRQKKLVAS